MILLLSFLHCQAFKFLYVVSQLCLFIYFHCICLKDVLFVDSGDPWNPHPATVSKVMAMLEGVHKVLKSDGIFISITFGQVQQTN